MGFNLVISYVGGFKLLAHNNIRRRDKLEQEKRLISK